MPTILIFGVPYTGHVNPLYPVLRRLRAAGAEVIVVNDESYREPIEEAGARFRSYPSGRRYDRLAGGVQPTSMPGLARNLMALANELLRFTLEVIDEVQPDCVLHDAIACWALLAMQRRPHPAITLVTTFVFTLELSDRNVSGRARLRILAQLLATLPGILVERMTTRIRHRMRPLAIFEAFRDAEMQFVLSLGGTEGTDSLGSVPDNFIVREYVPQPELLRRVSVFLTHGGMNSVHESLLAGVPMLVAPLQEEEAVVARRVVDTGSGVAVQLRPPYGQADATELWRALETLLADDRYAGRAREVGDGLRAAGGEERAARIIMECAKRRRCTH